MSKKAKEYSPEFKFEIVKEHLRQESTQTEMSQRHGLNSNFGPRSSGLFEECLYCEIQ